MTDFDSRAERLDDHAARLLHLVVLPIVDLVHSDEVFDADLWLQRYDDATLRQIAVMLAGLVDPARPWQEALAWLTDPPAPLHADERFESPRPLQATFLDVGPLNAERYGLPEKK